MSHHHHRHAHRHLGADDRCRHMRGRPSFWEERGRREHRGGRVGRMFAHGDLHLVVLHLLAEKPRHGYELIKSIEEAAGGAYSPSPGTIYPSLTLLEEQGWIEVTSTDGAKKLYGSTAAGRAHLDSKREEIDAMLARMTEAGASRREIPPPVLRAFENVKLTLRMRLERGPIDAQVGRAIAEALDRAVAEIEKL